jgi:hypothetical protein
VVVVLLMGFHGGIAARMQANVVFVQVEGCQL